MPPRYFEGRFGLPSKIPPVSRPMARVEVSFGEMNPPNDKFKLFRLVLMGRNFIFRQIINLYRQFEKW